jgi:DNA mismatch repair protein MutS
MSKESRLEKQYAQIKREYPDVILLFRLGDFYEMFGEDAVIAARELELTLTGRKFQSEGERTPMCGVPHHAAERYVARLIAKGYRVAVCDQMEDARYAKDVVRRQVTRVVTPGTVLEDSMLEAKRANYLVAVVPGEGDDPTAFGIAVCDVSTGEFLITEITGAGASQRAAEEVARLAPAELLLAEPAVARWGSALTQGQPIPVTPLSVESFPRHAPRDLLLRHFKVASLRGFGCEELPLAVAAAASVLRYLTFSQLAALEHVRGLSTYSVSDFMGLDATARRNLELTTSLGEGGRSRSLLSVIDATCTPMGGRLLRKWLERPLLDVERINRRLDAVEELAGAALLRGEIREPLAQIADLERLIARCATATANARDLIGLKNSLAQMGPLREAMLPARSAALTELRDRLDGLDDVVACIAAAIVDEPPLVLKEGGLIRPGYSEALDTLRTTSSTGKDWIASLEATERERTGIKSLKVGYNSVFGYYIEVTKPNLPYVPDDYIRKQTTANGERYITPDLKEQEAMILGAEERIFSLEFRLFSELREAIGKEAARVLDVAAALAELDVLAAFAETATRNAYARPVVEDSPAIEIRNGRHPTVEKLGAEAFIPNDCLLDEKENRLLVITGPNMSGKSTFLRQVALIVLLAQCGSMVPADSARIGIVDRIFTRVGAHDDLASGQSTFMVEMNETASILNNATERSLIILDEIGRGTSTYDGLSIAWAVCEYLQRLGAKTLFATHYHHLNDLAEQLPGIKNYRAAVKEDGHDVIWLRKIVPGGTDRSYGIQVARLAGLPQEVIRRAQEVLHDLENGGGAREAGTAAAPPSDARVQTTTRTLQLSLFEAEEHPALKALRKLDVTTMTPVEALTRLYELQRQAGGK